MFYGPTRGLVCQLSILFGFLIILWVSTLPASAQQPSAFNVTTHHYDSFRTGWNPKENELTPSKMRAGSFGLLRPPIVLDEQVDAQPLIVSNVTIAGQAREIAYVATANNTVYAIEPSTGNILQQRSLGSPVLAGKGKMIECGNNASVIGITATPVIDRASDTLYVVTFNNEDGQPVYRIHALDLSSLADKIPSRIVKASAKLSDGSSYDFNPRFSRHRAALVLSNGNVYTAFASFCDHDSDKTRGWVLGWRANTLEPVVDNEVTDHRAQTANDYYLSSIWMAGYGPAVDETGNLYFITGNSRPDAKTSPPSINPALNLQESVVKMDGNLHDVLDFFTPSNFTDLDTKDNDFGSGAILVIPGQQPGPAPHLAVAAGKVGTMFLLDRDNLGKFDPSGNKHVLAAVDIGRCWCGESYYVGADNIGRVLSSGGNTLSEWKLQPSQSSGLIKEWDAKDSLGSDVFQKGFLTSVSSNGVEPNSAVVWAVQRPSKKPPALALWAFDGKDGSTLVAGIPAGNWPNTGGAANTVPVVANGRVYVASSKELRIFGLGATMIAAESAREESLVAAARQTNASLFGTVVEVDGPTLWLRTLSRVVRVDIAEASANRKTVTLTPGRAVMVNTSGAANGTVKAAEIEYAPESPSLWPTE
jgi:hypothetical protein